MTSTTPGNEKVILKSSDNERFEVEKAVAEKSTMLKNMFEDGCFEGIIPVTNVTGKTLAKVVEYCKRHVACSGKEEEKEAESLKSWDAEFLAMERSELFDLIMAANFLDVKGLLDITCKAVADMIKDMSPEEIRKTFNIVNDFTPEEEEKLRRENQWAFE